jgi:23S rRNA (pseudouridine1915-N3)-methyltransferase
MRTMARRERAPRIHIVCVGALRAPHDAPGRLYEERVDRMAGLRVDEVKPEAIQRGEDRARAAEAERLRGKLPARAHTVALDPTGRMPASSEAFAEWLRRRIDQGRPVAFIIGGALGIDAGLLADCDERTSLSPLTMPHQLARVVLTEQLYRALCIIEGHPYPH